MATVNSAPSRQGNQALRSLEPSKVPAVHPVPAKTDAVALRLCRLVVRYPSLMLGARTSRDSSVVAVITIWVPVEPDDDGGHEANHGERPDDKVTHRGQGEKEQADRYKNDRCHEPPQEPSPPRAHEELIIRSDLKTDPSLPTGETGCSDISGFSFPPSTRFICPIGQTVVLKRRIYGERIGGSWQP